MEEVSLKGLLSQEPLELLKLAFLINKEKLAEQFKKVQIEINCYEDLVAISEIINKKYDLEGKLYINGNPAIFNSMDLISLIEYTEEEKEMAKTFVKKDI